MSKGKKCLKVDHGFQTSEICLTLAMGENKFYYEFVFEDKACGELKKINPEKVIFKKIKKKDILDLLEGSYKQKRKSVDLDIAVWSVVGVALQKNTLFKNWISLKEGGSETTICFLGTVLLKKPRGTKSSDSIQSSNSEDYSVGMITFKNDKWNCWFVSLKEILENPASFMIARLPM